MLTLSALLVPILLAAVAVFVVSSVAHMVLPLHRSDMRGLPGEDAILDAMRNAGVSPGEYMFPWCSSIAAMGSAEMKAKFDRGPMGSLIVRPAGGFGMGKSLGQWFALCVITSLMVGYVATLAIPAGASGHLVFRFASAAAFLSYAFGSASNSIWKAVPWSTTCKFVLDALLYSLATGGVFALMWPAA
jgi:hypothetical protein